MGISNSYTYMCDLCAAKVETPHRGLPYGWVKVWLTKGDHGDRVWSREQFLVCDEHKSDRATFRNVWDRLFGKAQSRYESTSK